MSRERREAWSVTILASQPRFVHSKFALQYVPCDSRSSYSSRAIVWPKFQIVACQWDHNEVAPWDALRSACLLMVLIVIFLTSW